MTADGAAERGEHWWPVAVAILVTVVLHVALPTKYRVNPPWVAPVVLLGLLAAMIIGDPGRIDRQKTWLRVTTSTVIALLTLANLYAAARLVGDIVSNNKVFATNATGLLATGAVLWATNVIAFALWYWDLDRDRVQPHRRFGDQTVGQAADDHRSGCVPGHRSTGRRPRGQHLEIGSRPFFALAQMADRRLR